MKIKLKWFVGIVVFIFLSHFPPLYGGFRLFGDGVLVPGFIENEYITQDTAYVYCCKLNEVDANPYFKRYKLLNPHGDFTLHRLQPIQPWKFWRWYEYVTNKKWRQPYMDVPYDMVHERFESFGKKYEPYYGSLPPKTRQDSIAAANPMRVDTPLMREVRH